MKSILATALLAFSLSAHAGTTQYTGYLTELSHGDKGCSQVVSIATLNVGESHGLALAIQNGRNLQRYNYVSTDTNCASRSCGWLEHYTNSSDPRDIALTLNPYRVKATDQRYSKLEISGLLDGSRSRKWYCVYGLLAK